MDYATDETATEPISLRQEELAARAVNSATRGKVGGKAFEPMNTSFATLWAETLCLIALIAVDIVFGVRANSTPGVLPSIAIEAGPGLGPVAAILAVLRRRFPDRVEVLAAGAIGLSLLGTAISGLSALLGEPISPQPSAAESLTLALLVGASCHRLAGSRACALAAAGGLAMVAAPVVRYGVGSPEALFAVPAALLWGAGIAVGLILRDAAARREEALRAARTGERLRLARELHDLVAHHITGVVVRAQAARVITAKRPAGVTGEVFDEIENAGAEALAAMRRLVGMLRSESPELGPAPADLAEAVRTALPEDGRVQVSLSERAAGLPVAPEVASTVHRIVLESLTNAYRHAPRATELVVSVDRAGEDLVVEVANDGARSGSRSGGGFGLVGMAERVAALGGSVRAGGDGGWWRVTARLPVGDEKR